MKTHHIAFGVGPAVSALLGLMIVPTLAWTYTQEDVGRYGLLLVALQLVTIVGTLGLDQSYVRWFHDTDDRRGLFAHCLAVAVLAGSLLAVTIPTIFAPPLRLAGLTATGIFALAAAVGVSVLTRMLADSGPPRAT